MVEPNATDRAHLNMVLINRKGCGKNEFAFDRSEDSKPIIMQYPWMVQLRHPFQNHEYVPCNGVLINENYVLTTNCVDWDDYVTVTLGDYRTSTVRDCTPREQNKFFCLDPAQIVPVAEKFGKDDLVLARLSVPAFIGRRNHIEAICLPTSTEQREELPSKYILTGWKESGNDSHYLQRTMVDSITRETCQEEMNEVPWENSKHKIIPDTLICVRNLDNPEKTPKCSDFQPGSAIQTIDRESNRYIAHGIQTGISYCSVPEKFIRIADYMEWLLDTIKP